MKLIEKFRTSAGREPFSEWIDALEETTQAKIYAYIVRLAGGGARRNVKPVGGGVFELKVDTGPGYRVSFGSVGGNVILLLIGGEKSTQSGDIRSAIQYWREYREKNKKL